MSPPRDDLCVASPKRPVSVCFTNVCDDFESCEDNHQRHIPMTTISPDLEEHKPSVSFNQDEVSEIDEKDYEDQIRRILLSYQEEDRALDWL